MELELDIKKKLPGFQLDIKLEAAHETIGILGASGSGKTMLLRCIAGLVKPDEGRIVMNGRILYDSEKKINLHPRERKTGFLFQNYALFPHRTIAENIGFGLAGRTKIEISNKTGELIERFHLSGMENRYPAQVSGGQQQRTALARALATDPEILLLDEPFSALDEHLKSQMIGDMNQDLLDYAGTVLFVTHDMSEVYSLSDRIAVLNEGCVDTYDFKKEVFTRPMTLAAAKITGCKNLAAARKKTDQSVDVPSWGITLICQGNIKAEKGFIGIGEQGIELKSGPGKENTFPVWLAAFTETPSQTICHLKIGSKPENKEDFHIRKIMDRKELLKIKNMDQPFNLYLDPEYIFFMTR